MLAAWSLAVSIIALVVSAVIGAWAVTVSRRSVKIEEERRRDEAEDRLSARFIWTVDRDPASFEKRLWIKNVGQSDAFSVRSRVGGEMRFALPKIELLHSGERQLVHTWPVDALELVEEGRPRQPDLWVAYEWGDGRGLGKEDVFHITHFEP